MIPTRQNERDPFIVVEADPGLEVHCLSTAKYHSVLVLWVVENALDARRAARALLPDLLCRETAASPGMAAMAARCEELFGIELMGSAGSQGARQVLRFGFECIDDRFAGGRPLLREAVGLLAEVLHDPPLCEGRFRPDPFEQERDNLVRAIEALADDKQLYAYRRMIERMHAGTPWALHAWGTAKQAAALEEPDVRWVWEDVRDTAPARLFIVGRVEPETAVELARQITAGRARQAPRPADRVPLRPQRDVVEVVERQRLAQSKLCMGFRAPTSSQEGAAACLFAEVFGGGSHSRLFQRVREREGLAYGCGAAVLLDSGTLVVQAGVDSSAASRTQAIVLEERDRLASAGVTPAELKVAQMALTRRLDALADDPRSLCAWRHAALVRGHKPFPAVMRERVQQVEPADVAAVAAEVHLDTVFLLEGTSP